MPGAAIEPVQADPQALLALHAAWPERYPALFESAAPGQPLGRYDILFAFPRARLTLCHDGVLVLPDGSTQTGSFLDALDESWLRERLPAESRELPFTGGWLLFLGYALAGQIEPRLSLPRQTNGAIAQAIRIPAAVIHERASAKSWIVAEAGCEALLAQIAEDLRNVTLPPRASVPLLETDVEEEDPGRFLEAVRRALDYISAGDIYQANLSRGWRATLRPGVPAHEVYRRLRETNPGPFSGIARIEDCVVISSSPERLVQVRDGIVATRPIAGTRPRGSDPAADVALARELYSHPKERAEHVMLIDLERNDLGRISQAGTVRVDEFMTIESYAHVHHIVSNVSGRLRAGVTPGQVLAAVFPGGTITGCPKVRCMEIIAELEGVPRGAYTGSLGYLNHDGTLDMNILIRSFELRGRELLVRAGAGIVADSVPERELEETRAKARGVLRALSIES
ncbi:MAG TPA: aminodeoxychorismate synthase component I [Steroidobacter sp.]